MGKNSLYLNYLSDPSFNKSQFTKTDGFRGDLVNSSFRYTCTLSNTGNISSLRTLVCVVRLIFPSGFKIIYPLVVVSEAAVFFSKSKIFKFQQEGVYTLLYIANLKLCLL